MDGVGARQRTAIDHAHAIGVAKAEPLVKGVDRRYVDEETQDEEREQNARGDDCEGDDRDSVKERWKPGEHLVIRAKRHVLVGRIVIFQTARVQVNQRK